MFAFLISTLPPTLTISLRSIPKKPNSNNSPNHDDKERRKLRKFTLACKQRSISNSAEYTRPHESSDETAPDFRRQQSRSYGPAYY